MFQRAVRSLFWVRSATKTSHLSMFPTSSPLGSAGAEMATRTRSAPPMRSKLLGLAVRRHCTCRRLRHRARSAPLGRSKWPLGRRFRLRTRSALLGRSKWSLEPARLRWGARNRRSNPLGSAGPETSHWAGPRMPVAFITETHILVHGMHGSALVTYMYMYSDDLCISMHGQCATECSLTEFRGSGQIFSDQQF